MVSHNSYAAGLEGGNAQAYWPGIFNPHDGYYELVYNQKQPPVSLWCGGTEAIPLIPDDQETHVASPSHLLAKG